MRKMSGQTRRTQAHRLKRLRQMLGVSQRELAEQFKVTSAAIALWETSARSIPGPVLKLIELYEAELGLMEHDGHGKDAAFDHIATSWVRRNAKLSRTLVGATTQLAGAALARALSTEERSSDIRKSTQVAVAKQLVGSLGELKGLAMKVGQMLSYLDFAMPPAAREVLADLQASATPMSPDAVTDVFIAEHGKTPRQIFAEWSPTPFAAASIGQVHRARLHDGRELAVKVQYPGIVKAVTSDMRSMAILDRLLGLLFPAQEKGALIDELRVHLLEECDYRVEAKYQAHFRALFGERADIRIPRVYEELSTQRILVSEYVSGVSFAQFLATSTQAQRDLAGERLFRAAWESIFLHGLFNADPHPGNYLFTDEQVVLLDFGCIKRYSDASLARWRRIFRAYLEDDRQAISTVLVEMGVVSDPKRYDFAYDRHMMHALYEPWLYAEPFRFSSEYVTNTWRTMIVENKNKFRMSMPRDYVFANRLQWGLYAVLALLNAQADWRGILLDLLYAPGEERPPAFKR